MWDLKKVWDSRTPWRRALIWNRKAVVLKPDEHVDYDNNNPPPPGYRWETDEEVAARERHLNRCEDLPAVSRASHYS
jgi:hypothetical protein